jgi:phosphoribosylamine--glycine ligase
MNILVVGSGAREHAMIEAFAQSKTPAQLFCYGTSHNPGISAFTKGYAVGSVTDCEAVLKKAQQWHIDLAIIGPEAPLAAGLVDTLKANNILCVGPNQSLARIESSKSFTRDLLHRYQIDASPRYRRFDDLVGVEDFLAELGEAGYVIKADGLMGGKGVKVAGDHLHSFAEAYAYCQWLYEHKLPFVIEEKLIGQEFSCHCFTDGKTYVPMPLVQDHKRAYDGDKGPNTGGMGSYSDANHTLPFLAKADEKAAHDINKAVIDALNQACGQPYQGILYGSYIATKSGIACIEFNARLGDPESLNMLTLMDTDFVALCHAIATGRLAEIPITFQKKATVCKYAVPNGYPDNPLKDIPIDISNVSAPAKLYLASVDEREGVLYACGSRTIAAVGVADTIAEAEKIAESAISQIEGEVFHRKDIGTKALIDQRHAMMRTLRSVEELS